MSSSPCFSRRLAAGAILALAGCGSATADQAALPRREGGAQPAWAARLMAAYPDDIAAVDAARILFRDGTTMRVSDGISVKSAAERQSAPDLDDMFVEPYVAGKPRRPPAPGEDPGRTRYEPFFDQIYGNCFKNEVAGRLRSVAWMPSRGGGSVRFATANGAADQLERVVRDLETLPPALTRYLVPSAGTYVCRAIAGTSQRSMHAYGVAIDIATTQADYWRWAGGEKAAWRNRIPFAIVAIFERHGFIWGGKWSHFDTMHFEYRPELLPPASDGAGTRGG